MNVCSSGIGVGDHLPKGNQVNCGEMTGNPTLLISLALFQSLQTVVGFIKRVFVVVCLLVCFFVLTKLVCFLFAVCFPKD